MRADPEAGCLAAHHAEKGGRSEVGWAGAANLPTPEEIEEALNG